MGQSDKTRRSDELSCKMRAFLIASISLVLLESCYGQTCITTSEALGKSNTACQIPWKFNGKLYYGCTTETDPDGRFWCSTKINKDTKEHIGGGGNWGYCRQSCPKCPDCPYCQPPPPPTTTPAPTTTPTPPANGLPPLPPPNGINDPKDGRYHPNEEDNTCGEYLGTGFILGGVETKRGELPYQAVLGYKSRRRIKYNCGGTLLNRRYVLTAAHCQHKKIRRFQIAEVVLGEWNLAHDPDCAGDKDSKNVTIGCKAGVPFRKVQRFEITAEDVIVHEDWDLGRVVDNGNDIALIRLPTLAKTYIEDFDQIVSPVCLGWDNTIEVPKSKFIVSGWGRTNNDAYDRGDIRVSGAHSAILQKLEVPLIDVITCRENNTIFKELTEKQVCAGGIPGKDSCSGDSGGPLVAQGPGDFKSAKYLIGVVSFGTKQCATGYPGVYTAIDYYLPWLIANMAK